MGFIKKFIVCAAFLLVPATNSGTGYAQDKNQSGVEEVALNRAESKIRDASVVVRDPFTGSYGSGTFFEIDGKNIVITAAHVVDGREYMHVIGRSNETVMGKVIYVDPNFDFAMITIPDMISRSPVKFKMFKGDAIGTDVTYTGHPARHDLLTVRGRVVGVDKSTKSILMNSFAWMGVSGSCVFTLDGKLVGVLVAVDVGRYDGRQIVEDIVWLTPISEIELADIKMAIKVHGRS